MNSLHQLNQGFPTKDEITLINHLLDSGLMISELVSTDSRSIKPGQFFVALKGQNFDGHEHIESALNQGAVMAVAQVPELAKKFPDKIILVDDTLKFLHRLANQYRQLVNPLVIAVTGSAGKTTAKELIKLGLENFFKLHATSGNFNNEIGVPLTIFAMPRDTQVLVLEMGMRGFGQIHELSQIAQPNICIITNIGTAHIELLGSRENIKKAKMEIIDFACDYQGNLKEQTINKTLIVDKNLFNDLKNSGFKNPNTNQAINENILFFDYSNPLPKSSLEQILFSSGLMADMNAVLILAEILGLEKQSILEALASYNPGKGRGQFLRDRNANIFIDETYNSNTEALKNSVYALLEQFPEDIKICVAGDIKESDSFLIEETFAELKKIAVEKSEKFLLLDVRNQSQDEIYKIVQNAISCHQGRKVILLKASRAVALDLVLEKLIND
jgi:UDP-N-acetylmuramoyl-tripeptide--D-alanyl-D-alanine ligase